MPIPLVTRILVADDHAIVRAGLRRVLDAQADMRVVAEAADGAEAVEKALAEDVHLAILDVSMPRMTGIQAAMELSKRRPELRLLDALDVRQRAVPVRGAASRCVGLRAQVRRGPGHRARLPRHDARRVVPLRLRGQHARARRCRAHASDDEAFDVLTPRELEVLKLIAEAQTHKEIAEQLVISVKTVERHRANILEKLGMRDRVELTRYAIRRGLIQA